MRLKDQEILASATDLAKHLACRHLTSLDLRAAKGEIQRIYRDDPAIAVLEQRGLRHEAAYLEHLGEQGYEVTRDDSALDGEARIRKLVL